MVWNRQTAKSVLLVLCCAIVFYTALQHLGVVLSAVGWLLDILFPFLLGGAIAFVLNVPMSALERRIGSHWNGRFLRPLSLTAALSMVLGILALAVCVIVPGIRDAVKTIAAQLPNAIQNVQDNLSALEQYWPQLRALFDDWKLDWQGLSESVAALIRRWGAVLMASGGSLVSGISNFAIGLIFSFYILLQKERLGGQCRRALYALLPEHTADRLLEIFQMTCRTFSSFLSGQCLEACILGLIFVVTMTLFRLPYAFLIGVLIALTALVPIVGAFIGCFVGALLIAVTNPAQAVIFVILFIVLQQIENKLIYPQVVGASVGLPSIWVLVAVTLGGKLFGVAGMIFFIPLCSVLYALFRQFVSRRLSVRQIAPEKLTSGSESA